MQRNSSGMNLDEGLALISDQEFESLYLESDAQCEKKLSDWLGKGNQAILFGGQIGSGKSTLIEQAFRLTEIRPDIIFHFDKNDLNLSALDAWINVCAEIARFSSGKYFEILTSNLPDLKQVFGETHEEAILSASEVLLEKFSLSALNKHQRLKAILEPLLDYLPNLFLSTLHSIEARQGTPLLLFAAGVDKFQPDSSAYFSLSDTLKTLAQFKTIFEVNMVHLFHHDAWSRGLEKIVLTAASQDWIELMLKKRLGIYAQSYQKEIPVLAEFSGGIPRQALRLLDQFLAQKSNLHRHEALMHAVENVNRDFFAFNQRPNDDLLRFVNKNKKLDSSFIALPGDSETAGNAVFGNWIIIRRHLQESDWEAHINPIIKGSFKESSIDDLETRLLKQFALQQGISANGLDFDTEIKGWQENLLSSLEKPLELNIIEILDLISSALLSKNRQDRVIIAYENQQNLDAVRAYLAAKSNSYEYQIWKHNIIKGGEGCSPLKELLKTLADPTIDVYSIELSGDFTKQQLTELNIRRDTFIDNQLIWWIPKEKLAQYLIHWTQLRQLFKLFVLEDDLSRSLNLEDIEADLNFMEDLVEADDSAESNYVSNLKIVLNYLKALSHG